VFIDSEDQQRPEELKVIEKEEEKEKEVFADPMVTGEVTKDLMHQHDFSNEEKITERPKKKQDEKQPQKKRKNFSQRRRIIRICLPMSPRSTSGIINTRRSTSWKHMEAKRSYRIPPNWKITRTRS
jgi:hypothetical protein